MFGFSSSWSEVHGKHNYKDLPETMNQRIRKSVTFETAPGQVRKRDGQDEVGSVDNVNKRRGSISIISKLFKTFKNSSSLRVQKDIVSQDKELESFSTRYEENNDVSELGAGNFPADDEELYQSFFDGESSEDDISCFVNSVFVDDEENFSIVPKLLHRYQMYEKGNVTDVKISTDEKTLLTDMITGAVIECDKRGKRRIFLEHGEMIEPWASAHLSDGGIVVTSRKSRVVYVFCSNGDYQQTFGKDFFQRPCGVAVDKWDRVIVSDCLAGEVSVHDRSGTWLFNLGSNVSPMQEFSNPQYIHVTETNLIVVSDTGNHSIKLFSDKGEFIKSFGGFGRDDGFLKSPHAICSDSQGQLIVADHYNDRVSLFSSDGEFRCHLLTSEDGILHPKGIILSSDGKLYVTHGQMKANEVIVYKFQKKRKTFITNNFMPLFDE